MLNEFAEARQLGVPSRLRQRAGLRPSVVGDFPSAGEFLVSTVIEGALELLEQPGSWTSGAQARDGSGAVVMPEADGATCWCVRGALRRVALMALRPYDADSRNRTLLLVEHAARHLSTTLMREFGVPCPSRNATRHLTEWNDSEGRRQADVVLLYRRTLGLEAGEEGRAAYRSR